MDFLLLDQACLKALNDKGLLNKKPIRIGHLVVDKSGVPTPRTEGKSKFETSNASEISNDKILCEKLAKNNTTFFGNINFWILSPRAETQYTDMYRKCLEGRNHVVLN